MDELRDQIAQVVMMGIEGLTPSKAERSLIERGVGGVILFARNCRSPHQVAELIDDLQEIARSKGLGIPLVVAIDQEHGPVTRITEGVTPFPSAWELGTRGESNLVRRAARITGRELASMGITMNLAPVADLLLHPMNRVIGQRSFGADPKLVGEMVAASVKGLQGEGIAACAKHFPGHGATATDSHRRLPTIERSRKEMENAELVPFRSAVQAGVAAVMTGHLLVPSLDALNPATLSLAIIQGLLRREIGFKGAVISDDLTMDALARWGGIEERGAEALKAGVDLLLVGSGPVSGLIEALGRGVATGEIPGERAKEAIGRVLRLKERYPYKGIGDLGDLRREGDVAFSHELFREVSNGAGYYRG